MANKKLEDIQSNLIDHFGKFPEIMGMNRALGVIWSTLAFEPNGLTMAELSKKTGYSLSSLSPYLRMLEMTFRVKCKKEGGVKKYYAETNLQRIICQGMQKLKNSFLEPMVIQLEEAEKKLNGMEQTEDVKNTLKVVQSQRKQYTKAKHFMSFFSVVHPLKSKAKKK